MKRFYPMLCRLHPAVFYARGTSRGAKNYLSILFPSVYNLITTNSKNKML